MHNLYHFPCFKCIFILYPTQIFKPHLLIQNDNTLISSETKLYKLCQTLLRMFVRGFVQNNQNNFEDKKSILQWLKVQTENEEEDEDQNTDDYTEQETIEMNNKNYIFY